MVILSSVTNTSFTMSRTMRCRSAMSRVSADERSRARKPVSVSASLQIPPARHRHHYVKARVRVHEYPDGTLALFHGPRCLARYNADGEPIDSHTRQAT